MMGIDKLKVDNPGYRVLITPSGGAELVPENLHPTAEAIRRQQVAQGLLDSAVLGMTLEPQAS